MEKNLYFFLLARRLVEWKKKIPKTSNILFNYLVATSTLFTIGSGKSKKSKSGQTGCGNAGHAIRWSGVRALVSILSDGAPLPTSGSSEWVLWLQLGRPPGKCRSGPKGILVAAFLL